MEAFFEVSAVCNLRCRMCAINVDRRYRPAAGRATLLTPETLERFAGAFPTLLRAYLFGLGEPLLNPHLTSYVRRLSREGVQTWFNTNATLMDVEAATSLAAAGLDAVTVSIDGGTPATYEAIRRGARFDDVVRGLDALAVARERFGRPAVDLSFVAMASNLHELPMVVELAARVGATAVHVEPLYRQVEATLDRHYEAENLGNLGAASVRAVCDRATEVGERLGVSVRSRFLHDRDAVDYAAPTAVRHQPWRCSEPWSSMWVTTEGEVRTCCLNDTIMGTVTRRPFPEVWNGPEFADFRRAHAGARRPASCVRCERNGRVRNSPFFSAIEAVTYRPLSRPAGARAGRGGAALVAPGAGRVVGLPLTLVGRVPRTIRLRPTEVVIDRTPVACIDRRTSRHHGVFTVTLPLPFLTEGAHLLWLRPAGESDHPGWDHREIHVWRPEHDRCR